MCLCVGVHRQTRSSLLLQQCPACLTWTIYEMRGKWPYSCCFVGSCFYDLFQRPCSLFVYFSSSFFHERFIRFLVVQPYDCSILCQIFIKMLIKLLYVLYVNFYLFSKIQERKIKMILYRRYLNGFRLLTSLQIRKLTFKIVLKFTACVCNKRKAFFSP